MYTIGIIEDDNDLRDNIEDFFKINKQFFVIFSCNSIEEWIKVKHNPDFVPDIILLDIRMPGISGLKGFSHLKLFYQSAKIIFISGQTDPKVIWDTLLDGADGYITKPFSFLELESKINTVMNGGVTVEAISLKRIIESASVSKKLPKNNRLLKSEITKREQQVIDLLLEGYSYFEIATHLKVAYSTINQHIKNIYKKLNVTSKTQLFILLTNKLYN
jgi:DNA-binding NarL/FixJ family response regulator